MTEKEIAKDLLSIGAVFLRPEQPFTWASGIKSPIYCDNRLTLSAPEVRNRIEGKMEKGTKVVVIEDLISTGGSCIEVVDALREAGAEVLGIVSIFTYGMKKGLERIANANTVNYSLSNLDALVEAAVEEKYIAPEWKERIIAFRNNPSDESWIK